MKILRVIGTGMLAVIVIRILNWVLAPVLPLLIVAFIVLLILLAAVSGFKRGL